MLNMVARHNFSLEDVQNHPLRYVPLTSIVQKKETKGPSNCISCQECEYGDSGCVGQQDKLLLLRDLGGWGELRGDTYNMDLIELCSKYNTLS